MNTYAKNLPVDRNFVPMQAYPPAASSLGTTARDNASTSSVTVLSANTTTIEVAAVTTGAVVKWVADPTLNASSSVISAAGTANFDHFVQAGTVRQFVVPRLTQAIPNTNAVGSPSVVGLNTAEGLFANLATKSVGVGSVLLTEY